MSQRIDSEIKEKVNNFTGQNEYKVGDITRAIIKKVASGEYNFADIVLLSKILIKLGADFSPVATILPVRLLLELFDYSIALELSEKFVKTLSVELDKRLSFSSDDEGEYIAGDLTRKAILEYTGKDDYSFGDISGKMLESKKQLARQSETYDTKFLESSTVHSSGIPREESEGKATSSSVDVLQELEECLAMERALIEKLERLKSQK
mmetsp:Transcript_13675/g.18335  ORF Transcript_13675/g.18335 Transcript_13675/m.18335 type:complete len:208 (+) Transcript_13675:1-624(+)